MKRIVVAVAGALTVALGAAACGSSSTSSTASVASTDQTPVTLTVWSGFTGRELGILDKGLANYTASHPWVKIKSVGGISDDKIIAAIRGGNAPDVAISFSTDNVGNYCSSGAWIDLNPLISQSKLDMSQFPKAVREYTQYQGKQCSLPLLADDYGLYYNTKMFADAGISSPPTSFSELAADAQKLTVKNSDGSFKVVGFDPYMGWYENAAAHFGPNWNAQWQDSAGKATISTSPGWTGLLQWQKPLIDFYGYDKLVRWQTGAGDEFSASNAFETGKVAMVIDGEYRTAFLKAEHPELQYATAPFPVDDSQAGLLGGGYITGTIMGIPKNTSHQSQAWGLLSFMATDVPTLDQLAEGLRNVPSTIPALADTTLQNDPKFATFLKIFADPHSQTTPGTPIGGANQNIFQSYIQKWQAGNGGDLHQGLVGVDQQIDAQTANATGQQVP